LSPERELKIDCKECRATLMLSPTSKRSRFPNEQTPRALGCETCDLKGSDVYEYMPRIKIILYQYGICCGIDGNRSLWPFDPSPMRNPRFIRECFGIIDAKILDRREKMQNDYGL